MTPYAERLLDVPNASSAPTNLPRGLVVLLGAAGLVVMVAGIHSIAGMIGPIFLALMLVIAVSPVQHAMRKRGLPIWLGTVVTLVLLYAVLLGLGLVLAVSIARRASIVPDYAAEGQALVDSGEKLLAQFLGLTFWAWVLGALGALLAIPLTLLAKALLVDIDPASRWVNLFLEAKPRKEDLS